MERIAQANGIQDVTALQGELAKQSHPSPIEADPTMADQGVDQALKNMSAIERASRRDSL